MKLTHQTKGKLYVKFGALLVLLVWLCAYLWTVLDAPAYKFAVAVTGGIFGAFCFLILLGTATCDTSEKDEL